LACSLRQPAGFDFGEPRGKRDRPRRPAGRGRICPRQRIKARADAPIVLKFELWRNRQIEEAFSL
jgi:hypothetical protein